MIKSFQEHKPCLSTQYGLPFGSLFYRLLVAGLLLIARSAMGQCMEQAMEHTGNSNITPYETNDGCFVEDIDFAYDRPVIVTIDESELRFPFDTRRYVGAVDGEGFLENAGQPVEQGALSEWVTLTFVGEIVLPDALGPLNDGFVDIEPVFDSGNGGRNHGFVPPGWLRIDKRRCQPFFIYRDGERLRCRFQ